MRSELAAGSVQVQAPAKVNLHLEVLAKRPDGYHAIESVMVAVNLYDTLEFALDPSGQLQLDCTHPKLGSGSDNLVLLAAEELRRRTGCSKGARIRLTKRIPLAAGLAGGSSDAAATLGGLNLLWRLGLSRAELAALAAAIGSDVAFFFTTPAAWCTGRGEIVTPIPLGRPLDLVLVCPPLGCSTAAVYGALTVPAEPRSGAGICRALAAGDVNEVGRLLFNRLQPVAQRLCPKIADWQARLTEQGPAGALMSGSGSSWFALCRDRREAVRLVRQLRNPPSSPLHKGGKRGVWQGSGSSSPAPGSEPKLFVVRSCD